MEVVDADRKLTGPELDGPDGEAPDHVAGRVMGDQRDRVACERPIQIDPGVRLRGSIGDRVERCKLARRARRLAALQRIEPDRRPARLDTLVRRSGQRELAELVHLRLVAAAALEISPPEPRATAARE